MNIRLSFFDLFVIISEFLLHSGAVPLICCHISLTDNTVPR